MLANFCGLCLASTRNAFTKNREICYKSYFLCKKKKKKITFQEIIQGILQNFGKHEQDRTIKRLIYYRSTVLELHSGVPQIEDRLEGKLD